MFFIAFIDGAAAEWQDDTQQRAVGQIFLPSTQATWGARSTGGARSRPRPLTSF